MANQTVFYFASLIKSAKELNRKEKEILLKRLRKQKLEKIGRKYKVSGERIRQIEESALEKFIAKMCQLMLFD